MSNSEYPQDTRFERFLFNCAKWIHRIYIFARYFRIGRSEGYPLCCVINFAWDGFCKKSPKDGFAQQRGTIGYGTDHCYVPCKLHTRRGPDWTAWNDRPKRQLQLFTMEPRK